MPARAGQCHLQPAPGPPGAQQGPLHLVVAALQTWGAGVGHQVHACPAWGGGAWQDPLMVRPWLEGPPAVQPLGALLLAALLLAAP